MRNSSLPLPIPAWPHKKRYVLRITHLAVRLAKWAVFMNRTLKSWRNFYSVLCYVFTGDYERYFPSLPSHFPSHSGWLDYKLAKRRLSLTTCFYTNESLTSVGTSYYVISSSVSSYYSFIRKFDEIFCYLVGFHLQL